MGKSCESRRPRAAFLASVVVLGAILGLAACADGADRPILPSSAPSIDRPSLAPSIGGSGARPEPSADAESPTGIDPPSSRATRTPEQTTASTREPTRTATTEAAATPVAPAPTTARTATAATPSTRPTDPATTATPSTRPTDPATTASPLSGTAVSDTSGGVGTLGWFLLLIMAAAVVGGVLVWRSRRNADWAADADALTVDTRAVIGSRLPSVLATVTAAQRALSWPPVRADLVELLGRWALLPERAPGQRRADWSRQAWGQLQEMLDAVDAENEALAAGRPWRPLRLRVDDAGRALFATLSGRQGPTPDAAPL